MQLVEKQIIGKNQEWFTEIADFSLLCKDLYNTSLYHNRQVYFRKENNIEEWAGLSEVKKTKCFGGQIWKESAYRKWMTKTKLEQYYKLPTQVAKEVVRQQYKNWKSFSKASFEYQKIPINS